MLQTTVNPVILLLVHLARPITALSPVLDLQCRMLQAFLAPQNLRIGNNKLTNEISGEA